MAGVLQFFYNDALDSTEKGQTVESCSEERVAPTSDLIINYNFLQKCDGEGIVLNKGTFVIFTVCVAMICHEWNFIQPVKKWIPESAILLMMGLILGVIRRLYIDKKGNIDEITGQPLDDMQSRERSPVYITIDWLKFAFLPMVILNASYELYHLQFFRQIYDILFLTFVGTCINIIGTCLCLKFFNYVGGLPNIAISVDEMFEAELQIKEGSVTWSQFFLFSSALAAVDPVSVLNIFHEIHTDTTIYYLLFGESTLNDGVTYALFGGIEKMMRYKPAQDRDQSYPVGTIVCLMFSFVTGPILAIFLAIVMVIISSFVCKVANIRMKFFLPYIVTGFVWLGFYIAEKLGFSAIIFTIVCALGQIRYTFPNITYSAQKILRGMIRTNAVVLEITVFALMGFNMAYFELAYIGYAFLILIIILVLRLVVVFGLFTIVNSWRQPENRVSYKWQIILFVGGLRGALGYIMAEEAYHVGHDIHDKVFKDTILIIIFLTIILNGMLIKPLISYFKLTKEEDTSDNFVVKINQLAVSAGETLSEILGGTESNRFGIWLGSMDRKIKKFLCKDLNTRVSENREDYTNELIVAYNWLERHPQKERINASETLLRNQVWDDTGKPIITKDEINEVV